MSDAVSREMILPAIRLDVPPRPTGQQIQAFAERSADLWAVSPRDLVTQHVIRLAVAAVLEARMEQALAMPLEGHPLPSEAGQPTLAQFVAYFRPHVDLAAQAFRLGVVEAVNARVPAVVDPLRDGLRRVGVTGRDPLKMVALGLEKVPERARAEFWRSVKSSPALTALVDGLSGPGSRDVSGLDRSHLARADVAILGGGRATAAYVGTRPRAGEKSWLSVPLGLTHRAGHSAESQRRGRGDEPVEVSLRASSWLEVFETALDAVGSAMAQIDAGTKGRSGGSNHLATTVAHRLAAAKDRPVADVIASLRAIDPLALEMFDHQVTTTSVRIAVPVIDDEILTQLWMPTSALAGPLFTGSADLFMGEGAEVRFPSAAKGAAAKRPQKPGQAGRSGQRPGQQTGQQMGEQAGPKSSRSSRRGRGRGSRPVPTTPSAESAQQPSPAPPAAPEPGASPAPENPTAD